MLRRSELLYLQLAFAPLAAASLRGQLPSALGQRGSPAPAPMIVVDLPTAVPLSDECKMKLETIVNDTAKKEAMQKCDEEKKFVDAAIEDLKKSAYSAAEEKMINRYKTCAKIEDDACATDAAKISVMDIRMMGGGISTKCEGEFNATEQKFDLDCEDGQYITKVGTFLNDNDLVGAVDSMSQDLEECSKLAATKEKNPSMKGICKECAEQLGPVMLYNLIIAAANRKVASGDVTATPPETKQQAYMSPSKVLAQKILASEKKRGEEKKDLVENAAVAMHDMLPILARAKLEKQMKSEAQSLLVKASKVLPKDKLQNLAGLLETAMQTQIKKQLSKDLPDAERRTSGDKDALKAIFHPEAFTELNSILQAAKQGNLRA